MGGIIITTKDVKQVLEGLQIPNNFTTNMAKYMKKQLLQETHNQIVKEVNRSLHSTKEIYKQNLVLDEDSVELNGVIPNMIEDGASAFDLKQGFENSPKRKTTKNGGWYLTIPFNIKTPTGGSNTTRMTWEIYRAVLTNQKYNPGQAGSRKFFRDPSTGVSYPTYQHKSPILAGINRFTNPSTGMNKYKTFRRVSNRSEPNSWIHRGFVARKFFDKAWANVDLERIIDNAIDNCIGDY